MNDKLTPQEAALYLGQEIQFTDSNGKVRVFAIYGDIITELEYDYTDEAKLLLRPLSDIQEEEARHVLSLRLNGSVIHELKIQAPAAIHIRYSNSPESTIIYRGSLLFDRLEPREVQYLLSIGIDVFGWIEAGKAIDKTKQLV